MHKVSALLLSDSCPIKTINILSIVDQMDHAAPDALEGVQHSFASFDRLEDLVALVRIIGVIKREVIVVFRFTVAQICRSLEIIVFTCAFPQ